MLSQATKTIIGIMIIKFASGFISDWGVIGLYILSYYHYNGAPIQIKSSTNSLIMIILVFPVIFCLFISTRLANKIGYVKLIRICSICYLLLPLISFFNFSFMFFMLFNMIAPACSFTLTLIPLFHCMYSYFGKSKNLTTAMIIGSFSIGAIAWNLIATISINPDNLIPDVPSGEAELNWFPIQVANRVPRAMNYIYLVSGVLVICGMMLISKNQDYRDQDQFGNVLQVNNKDNINLNVNNNVNNINNNVNNNNINLSPSPLSQHNPKKLQKQTSQTSQIAQYIQAGDITQINPITQQTKFHMLHYLKQPIVILLFSLNIFGCLYQVYVQLNTKLIYMSILQDDHIISIGLMIIIFSSAVFSVPWGFLADKKGPYIAIIMFIIIDFAVKIFSAFVKNRIWYLVSMALIGATDKTMLVIFAPILIDIYGLKIATQLLPLKGISGIISVIIASGLGMWLSRYAQKALFWLCGFNIIGVAIGIYLAMLISKHQRYNNYNSKNNNINNSINTNINKDRSNEITI